MCSLSLLFFLFFGFSSLYHFERFTCLATAPDGLEHSASTASAGSQVRVALHLFQFSRK
eukprot:m.197707 g.197707  ORF g.197707 m.197707 type:complete len:59 (+) comp53769_c0_seq13:563-739(+)